MIFFLDHPVDFRQFRHSLLCSRHQGVAPGNRGERWHTVRSQTFRPQGTAILGVGGPHFLNAILACQLLELRDPNFSILEHRADLEPAAHGFDVFGQGADTDVGPVLDLRNLSLIDAEDFGGYNYEIISCAFRN